MTVLDDKAALRAQMRARRKDVVLSGAAEEKSLRIVQHILAWAKRQRPQTLASYCAIGSEPNITPVHAEIAGADNWVLVLPFVPPGDNGTMTFKSWQVGDIIAQGPHQTLQPEASARNVHPDTVLLPLLAFEAGGGRLGQGGGYYDRALASLGKTQRPRTIGVAFACQEVDHVPIELHDAALDAVVTEHGLRYLT